MENVEFGNACYEVLEILKYIKEDDVQKIPEYEIQILKRNANYEHNFKYNSQKDIKEQKVSKLAKGIIAVYFYKYTATERQKEKIKLKQQKDLRTIEEEKSYKYNPENIFKKEMRTENEEGKTEEKVQLIEYKPEKWYMKIFNKIRNFFLK